MPEFQKDFWPGSKPEFEPQPPLTEISPAALERANAQTPVPRDFVWDDDHLIEGGFELADFLRLKGPTKEARRRKAYIVARMPGFPRLFYVTDGPIKVRVGDLRRWLHWQATQHTFAPPQSRAPVGDGKKSQGGENG